MSFIVAYLTALGHRLGVDQEEAVTNHALAVCTLKAQQGLSEPLDLSGMDYDEQMRAIADTCGDSLYSALSRCVPLKPATREDAAAACEDVVDLLPKIWKPEEKSIDGLKEAFVGMLHDR